MLDVRRKIGRQGYAFTGTVGESEVKAFCVEENIVYDDFVRTEITTEMLYTYPQLFDVSDMG